MSAAIALAALVRTTVAASAACAAAWILLKVFRIQSPRVHRVAWALAILQGWAFVPWTVEVRRPAGDADRGRMTQSIAENVLVIREAQAAPSGFLDARVARSPAAVLRVAAKRGSQFAAAAWVFGAAMSFAWGVWRYVGVLRALPLGAPAERREWRREWRRQVRSAGLKKRTRVHLRMTQELGPLLYWAPWSYLVLAPRALWSALSADERESILRHELAHLRRRDLQKSLLARLAALPQWFNPLVRMAVRRFDEAGEWACDDAAAKCSALAKREGNHLAERDDYTCARLAFANVLLQAAECVLGEAALPGGQSLRGGVLARRIQRLVNPRFKEESMMKKSCLLALFFVTAIVPLVRIERVSGDDEAARPLPASKVAPQECKPLTVAEFMKRPRGINPERRAAAEKSDYVIEPPDVLLIEGLKLAPKSSLRLGAHDEILILAATGARLRIDGTYTLDIEGEVNLGDKCGRVRLAGLTTKEAEGLIQEKLTGEVGKVNVSVTLHTGMNTEQIAGRHLVAMDGRVNLGDFGTVDVAGMTPSKARAAIEKKLTERLEAPEVFVEVATYNSKVAYVILQRGAAGDEVSRLSLPYPLTAEWNVGKALASAVYPQPVDFSQARITLKRPAPDGKGDERVFPIAWEKPAGKPTGETNHPVLPGDRIFIDCNGTKPERMAPTAIPVVAPTSAYYTSADDSEPRAMQLHVAFVEDADGTLAEIDDLQHNGMTAGDSAMALTLLKILEKHKLVTKTSSPQLMCQIGQPATVEVTAAGNANDVFRVSVGTRRLDESDVVLEIIARDGTHERRSEVLVSARERKTIIMKLQPRTGGKKGNAEPAKYVFVTPEFVADQLGGWMRP